MTDLTRTTRLFTDATFKGVVDDSIALDFNQRHRRRIQMTSKSGKHFLLDMKEVIALRDNDVLELDDGTTVLIKAKAERVADITAADPRLFTRIAWHLGNRHLPTQILDGKLRIAYDHVIIEMVQGLGGTVEVTNAAFQPEGGAYAHAHEHHD